MAQNTDFFVRFLFRVVIWRPSATKSTGMFFSLLRAALKVALENIVTKKYLKYEICYVML